MGSEAATDAPVATYRDGKIRVRWVPPFRLSFGRAAEMQPRAAVHHHAIIHLDGFDPTTAPRSSRRRRRSWASVKTVQLAPGHSTTTITLNENVHEWPHVLDRTRSLVDGALRTRETAATPAGSRS